MEHLEFTLDPTPPFRLDLTAWVLRRRAHNTWDRWDGRRYRRVLLLGDAPAAIEVEQVGLPDQPQLRVLAKSEALPDDAEPQLTAALERLLGLHIDLCDFYAFAEQHTRLNQLAQAFRGFKPPRFLSLWETLLNAIACQQITLTAGVTLLNRLCERYGPASPDGEKIAHGFPTPRCVSSADVEALRCLGYSRQKGSAMLGLAGAIVDDRLDLEAIRDQDDAAALKALLDLRGIGRWTAEYCLLRGTGRLHFFPGDDVGARNNLRRWLGISEPLDYEGVRRIVEPFQPYAGFLYFHLLLDSLSQVASLDPDP